MLDFQQLLDCYRYQTPRIASTANKEPQLEEWNLFGNFVVCHTLTQTFNIELSQEPFC